MVEAKRKKKRATKRRKLSRLGEYIRDHGLKPNNIADVTGISRAHLQRLRYGQAEPTRPFMIWLTVAVRRLAGRRVRITELFDLGDGER